ncbi:MAG: hypothetical protein K0R54_4082, partial [Clostridiaceae bacterium]|nr:hypothetical protein [Clostridiaceae bacterium]
MIRVLLSDGLDKSAIEKLKSL